MADHLTFTRSDVADLFGDRAEGPAFLRAFGAGNGVKMAAVTVSDCDRLVGASSTFWLPFDLALDAPRLQPLIAKLRKLRAQFGLLRLHGLGGIHTGEPQLIIAGHLDAPQRDAAFTAMLDASEAEGRRRGAHLHAVMDVSDDDTWAQHLLQRRGYLPMQGVPNAWLHLPYASMEEYLASRSQKFRYNLKRSIARAKAEIEVSEAQAIDGALDAEIEELSRSQQAQAKVHLGGLELMPPGFHKALADGARGRVNVLQYRLKGKLVGFGYMIAEEDVVFGKTMGLSYPEGTDYNLVHFNLYCTIASAIRQGKQWLVLGQAGYPTKLRFGARLVRRTTFLKGRGLFRHLLPMVGSRLDNFSLARRWQEPADNVNYFDAHPSLPQPPVKRIWVPAK